MGPAGTAEALSNHHSNLAQSILTVDEGYVLSFLVSEFDVHINIKRTSSSCAF